MAKKADHTEDRIQIVEEALGKTEQFIEKNQKLISIVVGAIIVIVLGYFGFKKFYVEPLETEAQSQMFMAEKYFELDSLNLALNGDGNYLGFLDIIDDYGMTKASDLSHYYAGICYLKKGDFENAVDYLESFSADDNAVAPMAKGAIGDAYVEMSDLNKAKKYYLEAAEMVLNDFSTPAFLMRAGLTSEEMGEYQEAKNLYERIKKEYPVSSEGRTIDKHLGRVNTLMGN